MLITELINEACALIEKWQQQSRINEEIESLNLLKQFAGVNDSKKVELSLLKKFTQLLSEKKYEPAYTEFAFIHIKKNIHKTNYSFLQIFFDNDLGSNAFNINIKKIHHLLTNDKFDEPWLKINKLYSKFIQTLAAEEKFTNNHGRIFFDYVSVLAGDFPNNAAFNELTVGEQQTKSLLYILGKIHSLATKIKNLPSHEDNEWVKDKELTTYSSHSAVARLKVSAFCQQCLYILQLKTQNKTAVSEMLYELAKELHSSIDITVINSFNIADKVSELVHIFNKYVKKVFDQNQSYQEQPSSSTLPAINFSHFSVAPFHPAARSASCGDVSSASTSTVMTRGSMQKVPHHFMSELNSKLNLNTTVTTSTTSSTAETSPSPDTQNINNDDAPTPAANL